VEKLGEVRGIDPGRPGIPDYGSKLYHLNYLSLIKKKSDKTSNLDTAILRKCRILSLNSLEEKVYKKYKAIYKGYIETLNQARFSMIAFDYDGTLCGSDITSRFMKTIDSRLEKQLLIILKNNIKIAVITGRGKSVNTVLKNSIPREFLHLIYVGNYNGMIIYPLSEPEEVDNIKRENLNCQLEVLLNELEKRHISNLKLKTKKKKDQLSIESKEKQIIYELCQEIIIDKKLSEIHVWTSSHSMDIVVKSKVSKCNILDINDGKTLCIGDSGNFIGNDFELLSTKYSLSVDTVSLNPYSCWNIAPQNISGINATLYYLKSIKCIDRGYFECNFKI
jgi:hydroxymethylpyrimidine pyrophosphatase-like HAD family hydrolase